MIDCSEVTRLITHDNCADGLAAAMIVKDLMPHVAVTFAQYGDPSLEALEPAPGLLFCDITPPRARAAEFVAARAIVLDHHKHARDIVEMFGKRGRFADETEEPGISGAWLAFAYVWNQRDVITPDDPPTMIEDFARLTGVRDTWQIKSPEWERACDLQAVMLALPREYWLRDDGIFLAMSSDMLELGRMMRAERAKAIGAICAGGHLIMEVSGRLWAVFPDARRYTSDVAEEMRKRGVAVTCGWFQTLRQGRLVTVLSLRSDGDAPNPLDVGALCKEFGGGGHARAAGCTLPGDNPIEAVMRVQQ